MELNENKLKIRIKYEFYNPNEGDISAALGHIFGRAVTIKKQTKLLENQEIPLDFLSKK
ncbi:hypothetical protein FACS1894211_00570 [Clostridia bacterium]|nr:hypothetical protein FACS1894211_00570 [Clostridia bacterium]